MKNVKVALFAFGFAGLFVACSDDDPAPTPNEGRLSIEAIATYSPSGAKGDAQRAATIELSRFLVNFKEIELEFENVIDDDSIFDSEDDIELRGPFEVDLLSPVPVPLVNITLPNGDLKEMEFEFDKSTNSQSDLYKKSMQMDGTINGNPFVFWHDFEEEIEVEFDGNTENTLIKSDENGVVIHFNLNTVLDATPSVDLSTAVDGNGDGIIEISPMDEDGNRTLAEAMKQAIKKQIELDDDKDDQDD